MVMFTRLLFMDFRQMITTHRNLFTLAIILTGVFATSVGFASEQPGGGMVIKRQLLKRFIEQRHKTPDAPMSEEGLKVHGSGASQTITVDGRDMIIYTPVQVRPRGTIPLLVVLHGGMGNGKQIKDYIGLEPYADQYGFIIAYPNGTPVVRGLSENRRGWNAGECCGQSQQNNSNDVGFITDVVANLVQNKGVDRTQVYGTGHSNGAMMTQRLMCETDLYRAAVPISGPLELDVQTCPPARGKRILAIHGADDQNAPVNGGYGTNAINKKTDYRSQAYTKDIFDRSGAQYDLLILPEAQHRPETLNAALIKAENVTLPQKIVTYLGLDRR
jgi:poly(3-hydroxybutyrate) depolymerase